MSYHVYPPGTRKAIVVEGLRAQGLSGLLLTSPENVYYISGLPAVAGSDNPILFALKNQLPPFVYIAADGRTTLICWIGATLGFTFDVDEVRTFFNRESALDELRDFLHETLPPEPKLGIESSCPYSVLTLLEEFEQPPALSVADELLLQARLIKSETELALIRKATAIVEETVAVLRSQVKVGISRLWLIQTAKELMLKHGATGIGHTTIAFGTANPEIAFDQTLEESQLVTLDLGAVVNGYTSDNRRLLYTGAIPDDLQALHATMRGIVKELGETLRPGVLFANLYARAAELYDAHSLPPYFINVGHSIGLQTEEAWISFDTPYTVQAGMVLNIELYTSYTDGTNIGDEETFLVTETGALQLTQSDSAIQSA